MEKNLDCYGLNIVFFVEYGWLFLICKLIFFLEDLFDLIRLLEFKL